MASYYEKQSQGMAFTVGKEHFARTYCLRDAELILTAWLQGQERSYAVRAVLEHLGENFGVGAVQSVALIKQALSVDPDDELARLQLVTKALDLLGHQVEAEGNSILRPGGKL